MTSKRGESTKKDTKCKFFFYIFKVGHNKNIKKKATKTGKKHKSHSKIIQKAVLGEKLGPKCGFP